MRLQNCSPSRARWKKGKYRRKKEGGVLKLKKKRRKILCRPSSCANPTGAPVTCTEYGLSTDVQNVWDDNTTQNTAFPNGTIRCILLWVRSVREGGISFGSIFRPTDKTGAFYLCCRVYSNEEFNQGPIAQQTPTV